MARGSGLGVQPDSEERTPRRRLNIALGHSKVGLLLLALAVAFNAWFAAPELRINRVPLNDVVFHLAASERMGTSLERSEPFLDPWVSEWSLGYPVWRSYQPLPHFVAALTIRAFRSFADPASIFAAVFYLLIVAFPISVFVGAQRLGLSRRLRHGWCLSEYPRQSRRGELR